MLIFDPAAHRYTWDGEEVPHVTGILREALGDPFERVPPAVLEYARGRGQAVHRARELDDAGQLDEASLDPEIAGYLEAWRRFRLLYRFKVIASEKPLYHPVLGYACTPDVVFESPASWGVIEVKSGFAGIYAELQTAAQLEVARVHFNATRPGRRFVMQLGGDGRPRLHECRSLGDLRDFLSCLNVYRIKRRIAA